MARRTFRWAATIVLGVGASLMPATVSADGDGVGDGVDSVVVAVGLPPVPPVVGDGGDGVDSVVVAVGLPPVPPVVGDGGDGVDSVVVAVGLPPVVGDGGDGVDPVVVAVGLPPVPPRGDESHGEHSHGPHDHGGPSGPMPVRSGPGVDAVTADALADAADAAVDVIDACL